MNLANHDIRMNKIQMQELFFPLQTNLYPKTLNEVFLHLAGNT